MRAPVSDNRMARLVGEKLQSYIAMGAGFTAYNITRALRMEQPHLNIRHEATRGWVHCYMQGVLCTGRYTAYLRAFRDGEAIVYVPAVAGSGPIVRAVPDMRI